MSIARQLVQLCLQQRCVLAHGLHHASVDKVQLGVQRSWDCKHGPPWRFRCVGGQLTGMAKEKTEQYGIVTHAAVLRSPCAVVELLLPPHACLPIHLFSMSLWLQPWRASHPLADVGFDLAFNATRLPCSRRHSTNRARRQQRRRRRNGTSISRWWRRGAAIHLSWILRQSMAGQ